MGKQSRKKKERRAAEATGALPPRRRRTTTTQGWSGRTKLIGAFAAIAALAAIALVVAFARGGGGSGGDPIAKLTAAGCTFRTYPDQGRAHTQNTDAKVNYNSFPPTSGEHYIRPAVWGSYTSPLSLIQEVHNLEHGGVIIQYGNKVAESTVAQLQSFYEQSPNGMLLAPLPKLGATIALTSWRRLAKCERFEDSAFAGFRDAYRGKGPERFPVDSLVPGS